MGYRQVMTPSGQPVCVLSGWSRPDNALEDAEYIVHACNAYPGLVERVARLVSDFADAEVVHEQVCAERDAALKWVQSLSASIGRIGVLAGAEVPFRPDTTPGILEPDETPPTPIDWLALADKIKSGR